MKMQHVFGVGLGLLSSVWAQPAGQGTGVAPAQDAGVQRRTELRQALQPSTAGTLAPAAPRQLSPQERQALREQLRQQRPPAGAARSQP